MLKSRSELSALREEYAKAYAAQSRRLIVCAGTGCA